MRETGAPDQARSPGAPGPVRVGRYELFARIGAGGMATVHLGRLLSAAGFARTVAVKRPLPALTSDENFRRIATNEARLASRVYHPNVVATLDVIEQGSELLVVMDYVHGESLATLMNLSRARGERVPLGIVRAVLLGMLRGLHAVHQARNERGEPLGLIHRDVSPQNVLCSADGSVRIADFGLAKAAGEAHVSGQGEFKGKLTYASPEQVELRAVTPATDIYSAGLILWELLVGERLHAGLTSREIVARLIGGSILRPSQAASGVPALLDAIVEQALRREPSQRFDSALTMASAIEDSGVVASIDEIVAWVDRLAGETLADRQRLVMAAERETTPSKRSSSLQALAPIQRQVETPYRRSHSGLVLRVLGLAAGAGVGWTIIQFLNPREPKPESGATIQSVTFHSSLPAQKVRSSPSSSPVLSQPAPSIPSLRVQSAPASRPAQVEQTTSAECSPPFSIDSEGIRHMKPGCR